MIDSHDRDAALERVSHVRRWAIAGAAALTAGFAALVSAIAPGRTLGASTHSASVGAQAATGRAAAPAASNKLPPLASPADLGLQGPSSAPQADPSQSAPAPSNQSASPAPAPAPAPAPSNSGPAAVSGGS